MSPKIIFIIAKKYFKDEEYFVPKEILERAGFFVETVAQEKGLAEGVDGGEALVDASLRNVDLESAVAVVLAGGGGAQVYFEDKLVHNLLAEANKQGKIIGAICIAPTILAKAGILNGKKATVWSSPLDKKFVKILEENGCVYLPQPVVQDGNIITANGPEAAADFAQALASKLKNN